MHSKSTNLRALAVRRVNAAGLDWKSINRRAEQIIVFGSYALSKNVVSSDLDLLCIGQGRNFKSSKVHVVWIPEKRFDSENWLGSELATHVAAYGKWIKGENTWAYQTKPNSDAIQAKRKNIVARLKAMDRHWDDLLPRFRYNQLTKLRRDVQRYCLMLRGSAPLPKTLLDQEWKRTPESRAWRILLGNDPGLSQPVADFLNRRQIVNLCT